MSKFSTRLTVLAAVCVLSGCVQRIALSPRPLVLPVERTSAEAPPCKTGSNASYEETLSKLVKELALLDTLYIYKTVRQEKSSVFSSWLVHSTMSSPVAVSEFRETSKTIAKANAKMARRLNKCILEHYSKLVEDEWRLLNLLNKFELRFKRTNLFRNFQKKNS